MSNTHLKRAHQHYQNGELDEALEAYQLALEQQPSSTEILNAIAAIHAQLNHLDKAIETIDQALKQHPHDPPSLNNKANILARQNKLDAAIVAYNQAIKIDPNYAIAFSGLGKCLFQNNELEAAEHAFQQALKLKPHFIEAQYNYALLKAKQHQCDAAIKLLEPIVTEHPNFIAALGQLGELYLQTDDYERALRVLDRRAALEPDNGEALHSLAQAMALTHHIEEAVEYYEKTLMLLPHHPEANHNLANAYVKLGDTSKALTYYFKQIALKPLAESYFNIGVLMMYQERNKEAIEYFEHAAKIDSNHLATFLNLGSIYLKLQRHQDAINSYEKALALNPDNAEVQYIVDALKNDSTPLRAPNDYLRNLFNQYADYYDEHLTKYLEYNVPQKLAQILFEQTATERADWRVVDLGCGTGLSGDAFKSFAGELIGIDIAENMIESARKKNIYQQLIVGDIEQELKHIHDADLIVAADVFSYIGDLKTPLEQAYTALKPGGILLFSVERITHGDFVLQKNMRYAHSKNYLESIASATHFTLKRCDNTVLRKQQKQPVEGFLVLLQRPSV